MEDETVKVRRRSFCIRVDNGLSPRNDARVMATFGLEDTGRAVVLGGLLGLADGSRRLETDAIRREGTRQQQGGVVVRALSAPEVDILSVGDTTLDSSRPVGDGAEGDAHVSLQTSLETRGGNSRKLAVLALDKHVVVPATPNLGSAEA